ncbi:Acyl-CoA dehydrogenase [Actinacidiphila alni]|uniref:Dibenzothiophene monooxygenase n=1 Tax=Actinacidiphila alni TaxID=380248 RepID=A0A1I2IEX4_9ACTN|nr:acyl-CoA dehydrogenase family protein [Actinacidiphila alni]SFF39637.1 Acyl-CoA dehydrogenase [Actinacidiphila alni]
MTHPPATSTSTDMGPAPAPPDVGDAVLAPLLARIAEGAARRDQERTHPFTEIAALKAARVGAVRVPRPLGGAGWSVRSLLTFVIRLGEADPNVAHALRNHYAFVDGLLRDPGTVTARRWLGEAARGTVFGSAATELSSGTVGAQQFRTTLTPDGSGYRLNGTKFYSTGSLYADWITVPAVTPEGDVVTVAVPGDRTGVHRDDDWDGIGQRLTGTGTTRLERVRVEADEVLSRRAADAPRTPHRGALSQLYLTAVVAGILRGIVADGAAVLRSRRRTYAHAHADSPADDPLLQLTIGQIDSAAYAAQATVLAAADALDAHAEHPGEELAHEASLHASRAKIVVDRLGLQAASAVFDVGGASATARGAGLDRHWRNIRTLASHNPGAYKAQAIGDHAVNGTPLPPSGFF